MDSNAGMSTFMTILALTSQRRIVRNIDPMTRKVVIDVVEVSWGSFPVDLILNFDQRLLLTDRVELFLPILTIIQMCIIYGR
jgi:hypothetical protein